MSGCVKSREKRPFCGNSCGKARPGISVFGTESSRGRPLVELPLLVYSSVTTGFVARPEPQAISAPLGTRSECQRFNLHRFAAFCSLTDTTKGGYKVVLIDQT